MIKELLEKNNYTIVIQKFDSTTIIGICRQAKQIFSLQICAKLTDQQIESLLTAVVKELALSSILSLEHSFKPCPADKNAVLDKKDAILSRSVPDDYNMSGVWNVSELTGIGLGKYAPWVFSQMINSKRTKANIKGY